MTFGIVSGPELTPAGFVARLAGYQQDGQRPAALSHRQLDAGFSRGSARRPSRSGPTGRASCRRPGDRSATWEWAARVPLAENGPTTPQVQLDGTSLCGHT